MARLDRLGGAKELAQIGAAIGREFSHMLVEAVAGKPQADLDNALQRLISAGLLFRQGVPPHAHYLFKHGFRVSSAADAAGARAAMRGLAFDLVILDVMMPGESGLSLARDLKAISNVPVLMLTARAEPEQRIEGLEIGVDDYIAKPYEPRELLLRLRNILRRGLLPSGRAWAAAPARGGRLVMAIDSEPPVLTSAITTAGPAQWISGKIFDGLLRYDSNFIPRPQLARAWPMPQWPYRAPAVAATPIWTRGTPKRRSPRPARSPSPGASQQPQWPM